MTVWQERGGVPLATVAALLLAVCVGAVITVATYREETPEVPPPATAPAPRAQRPATITLDDLRAELIEGGTLTPAQTERVVRVLTDRGPVRVVVPSPTTTTAPPPTTTTPPPSPPPTTEPPVVTLPLNLLDQFRDEYIPPTVPPTTVP